MGLQRGRAGRRRGCRGERGVGAPKLGRRRWIVDAFVDSPARRAIVAGHVEAIGLAIRDGKCLGRAGAASEERCEEQSAKMHPGDRRSKIVGQLAVGGDWLS